MLHIIRIGSKNSQGGCIGLLYSSAIGTSDTVKAVSHSARSAATRAALRAAHRAQSAARRRSPRVQRRLAADRAVSGAALRIIYYFVNIQRIEYFQYISAFKCGKYKIS